MLVMYDMDYSPTCAKVRKLMDYKGLVYRKVPVPYHDKRRLIRETGQDYVPFLKDGRRGVPWTEAVDYLDRVAPHPPAYPGDSRAVVRILESWEYDWFEDRLWPFVAAFLEGTLRDPVERWNFGELWDRPPGTFDAIRSHPRRAFEPLGPSFALFEDGLRDREFLVLDAPTAFDFAIYGNLHALRVAGRPVPKAYPRLAAWFRRVDRL